MSVIPYAFLESASEIATNCSGEMAQRNALSRVYYAAYHRTREVIEPDGKDRTAPGINSRKPGMHRGYILQLEEASAGSVERRIAIRMKTLYSSRKIADYEIHEEISSTTFAVNVNLTKELFSLVDTLTTSNVTDDENHPIQKNHVETAPISSSPRKPRLTIVK